jgi:tetratricopeptide (TPR) repeat protein
MRAILLLLALFSDELGTKAEKAKAALSAGDFSRAISLYRDLSQAFPQDPATRVNLGLALHSAGQYASALEQFEFVLRLKPDDRAALLFSGIDLLRLSQPAKAVQRLSTFLSHDGNNRIALVELGHAQQLAGNFEEANKVFLQLCDIDNQNPQYWNGLGTSYWSLAKRGFGWIEANAAFSAEWYALLGRSELQQERYGDAFQLYRQALARSPGLPGVHSGLAQIYRKTGHSDWAAIEESREVEIKAPVLPGEVIAQYLKTLEYQQRAYDAWDHLSHMTESAELHELLGQAYRAQQRDHESADEFRRALALDKGNAAIEKEMATSLWLSGDFAAARPIFERLIKANPTSPNLNHLLGDCLVQLNEAEKAIPFLETAVRENANLLPAQASLGRAYLHTGRYAQAVVHLEKALPLNYDALFFQLSEAYKKMGNGKEAARYLAEFKGRSEKTQQALASKTGTEITPP